MRKKSIILAISVIYLLLTIGFVSPLRGGIPTFQELMDPNFCPNAQFGMKIENSSIDDNSLKVETTGSVLQINFNESSFQFAQKIGKVRNILKVEFSVDISKPIITHSKSGMVFVKFEESGFDFRANGDSLFMIHAKKPLTISLKPDFIPVFDGNYQSNHLLLDEYGGFGVYCSIIDLPDKYNKLSETIAVYDLPEDSVLWISICPPKKYDWQKSINDNVLWHWSTVTSYPDDETIKSWIPYGNTVLFQGEIMLWKDWNLGFEPRLGIKEWNRVKNTLHQNKMRYMVYTSPYYYLLGTEFKNEAVNSFDNFKGWPTNKPTHGENVDLFIEAITKVMKELKPDGLYFDGTYRDNIAAQYKLARHTRNIVGENGLLEWHSTLAFGKTKVKDLCYLPQVDSYADYILRGEHLKTDFNDLNYLRYYVSGYNASNSIGVFCTRDHSFITEKFCQILFDNNIRLHLATGKENLRIKKYSGWVYQQEVLKKYHDLYLSKLSPGLQYRVEKLCDKRQEEYEKSTVASKNN
ncbi:MAG: hypothetical protein A2Y10_00045 [Planctomycetes bacterium GWF2_41_51]|nr:MAG: hypothetical protein A2Y10_00045 [Planctomycetes bacterium GWF2_41_51]HBG28630.1 hypothetical protein [Phycisphaerales bacterium]